MIKLERVIEFAHNIIAKKVNKNDICVDMTIGNGKDTLFLCNLSKFVYGFDIQQCAVDNTNDYLDKYLKLNNIDIKVIGFPIWADFFFDSADTTDFPKWKLEFVRKNQDLYKRNKSFIDTWINKYDIFNSFTPTQRKFEWQAGENLKSVYEGLIQFRPSGMRVKIPNTAPALVAMVQTSVIGKYERKISLKESLRLQDFPEDFDFGKQTQHECYKQLGNSICVKVLEEVTRKLLEIE